jgi:predicted permease
VKEIVGDEDYWVMTLMDNLGADIRYGVRTLIRTPLALSIAVLSIGLGVGANTAVFSWTDSLVLHPFPGIEVPDRVVGLETAEATGDGGPVSYPDLRAWAKASRSLSGVAGWTLVRVSARDAGESGATQLIAMATSGNYFTVLGGRMALGRAVSDDDEQTIKPVAVLSFAGWQRRYGGSPAILGRTLYLNGVSFTIVGVAAPRFVGTYVGVVPDLFVPITLQPQLAGINTTQNRAAHVYQGVARLADGATLSAAQQELDPIARRMSADFGDRPVTGAIVKDIRTQYLGGLVLPIFVAMLVVSALLLLVASANVASLLLVRATARQQEIALRMAIGASRARVAQAIGVESALLATAGAAVGVAIAYGCRGLLYIFVPTGPFPIALSIDLNARVLLVAVLAASIVVVACGVLPALRASSIPPANALRSGSRADTRPASRTRSGIVAAQLAFSLLCLATAGLFVQSLRRTSSIDPGFVDPAHVLLVGSDLSVAHMSDSAAIQAQRDIAARVGRLPGVQAATLSTMVPLGFGRTRKADIRIESYAATTTDDMSAILAVVGTGFPRVLQARVVSGRDFTDRDRAGGLPVAMVNEAIVQRFFPTRSPIGQRIDAGHGWATIIGVVQNGKYNNLTERQQIAVFFPIDQWPQPAFTIVARTSSDPRSLIESVRRVLRDVHVDLAALQPRTLADHVAASTFVPRVGAGVLSAFGALALVLSIVGLYGAISSSVALRSREIGIRLALGADARSILWPVLRGALAIAAAGAGVGVLLSVIAGRVVRAHFPGVSALDPASFAFAFAALVAAALLAVWRPAVRAIGIDPIVALRDD